MPDPASPPPAPARLPHTIVGGSSEYADLARHAIDSKTKPVGSLGRVEEVAVQLASALGTLSPTVDPARILVFAGDHGVADAGVSAYPRSVTREMLHNFSRGGAAINVIARSVGAAVEVIDVGVDDDGDEIPGIVRAKVCRGTQSFVHTHAMTERELDQALNEGGRAVRRAHADGMRTVGIGEMGIGNTTAAAALLCALTGITAHSAVGRGTGIDDAALERKREVVRRAIERHNPNRSGARHIMQCFAGLEIAAMTGAILEAGAARMTVIVDGFISTVAALFACELRAVTRPALHFSHLSEERGHAIALAALGAKPLLDMGMRLGEGTGAALALPIIRAAAAVLREMASFEEAGVSRKVE